MNKLSEVVRTYFLALIQIAHDIAFVDELSDCDKSKLNNAINGCNLLLIILEDGAPNLYTELKAEFDASIMEIKDKLNPSEYGFIGNLSFSESD